jgi:hypothetical protein
MKPIDEFARTGVHKRAFFRHRMRKEYKMIVRKLFHFLLSVIIGILFVKYFLLNAEESSYLNALIEKITSSEHGIVSRLEYLIHSLKSMSLILFLKLCIGVQLPGLLMTFTIYKLTGEDEPLQNEPTVDQGEKPTKKCPACSEMVLQEAKVCQFCNYHFV